MRLVDDPSLPIVSKLARCVTWLRYRFERSLLHPTHTLSTSPFVRKPTRTACENPHTISRTLPWISFSYGFEWCKRFTDEERNSIVCS